MQLNQLSKDEAKTLAITLNYHESLDALSFKDANFIWKTAGFSRAKGWTALKSAIESEYNNNTSEYENVEDLDALPEELRKVIKELSSDSRDKGFSSRSNDSDNRSGGFGDDSFGFGSEDSRRDRDREDRRSNRRGDRRETRRNRRRRDDDYDTDWEPRSRRRDDRDDDRDSFSLRTRRRDDDSRFNFRRDDDNNKVSKRKGSDFVSKLREKTRETEDVDTQGASLQDYLSYYFGDAKTVRLAFSFKSETAIKNANKLCDRYADVVHDWNMSREEAHELKVVLDSLIDFVVGIYKRRDYNTFNRISLTLRQTRREIEAMFWRTLNSSYGKYL